MKSWQYLVIGLVLWAIWWSVDATQANGSSSSASTAGGLGSGFIQTWAQAIASFENVNPAYNNPGGLNMVGDAGSVPAAGGTGHDVIGVFSSLQAGYNALDNTLNNFVAKYGGKSLLDATAIYVLGPTGAATYNGNYPAGIVNYANTVADQLGVTTDETLNQIEGNE